MTYKTNSTHLSMFEAVLGQEMTFPFALCFFSDLLTMHTQCYRSPLVFVHTVKKAPARIQHQKNKPYEGTAPAYHASVLASSRDMLHIVQPSDRCSNYLKNLTVFQSITYYCIWFRCRNADATCQRLRLKTKIIVH